MSPTPRPLDVAVIGVGRMGQHHARIYSQLAQTKLVAVVDTDAQRAGALAQQYGCHAYAKIEALLANHPAIGAVSVAVPTADHTAVAAPLLRRGVACLIEKPLAPTVEEARQLAKLAADHGAVLQVGHTERFNPAIQKVAAMGLKPRFIEVDRVSPMTFRSLDVGVVMDMMIHDLDIVLMLAASPLERVDATGVSVLSEYEDVANARLLFSSGCVANLTASRLALTTQRKLRVFSEDTYVSLDYTKHAGVVIRKSANAPVLAELRQQLAAGVDLASLDYSRLVHIEPLTMERPQQGPGHDPLTAQLISFIHAVNTGQSPAVDAAAGCTAIQTAQRVVDAIRSHTWEGLVSARV